MKSKELVYLASTAILLAATANVAKAEEHTIAESEVLKTERSVSSQNQTVNAAASQTSNQPTVAVSSAEQSVQAVKQEEEATNATGTAVESGGAAQSVPVETQVASAKPEGQSQPDVNASNQNETAADQSAKASSSVADSAIASEPKASPAVASAPKASSAGKTVFYNAGSKAQAARGNSQAEIKGTSFVDVSSHNGHISVDDYRKLSQQGVGGVVVKLTEGTHYTNPFAESQVRNAQGAGLQVSTYAFSHYTSDEEARAEARYYAAFANRLGLPKNTVMVNDMEDPKMQNGINQHTQAWADEMRRLGYSNLMYYTSASWLDQNNLRSKGPVNTSQFGYSNFWVAQYPSSNLNLDGAKSLKYNSGAGAWQFTAQAQLLAGKHVFDHSVDYSGRFTQQSALAKQPLKGNISIQNKNNVNGSFDVVISNVSAPYGVSVVSVPVWSEANGQDDIIWYTANQQANGTYKVSVDSSRHKDSVGKYNVHLYYVRNDGQLVGVGGTTTNVSVIKPQGKISIQNRNSETGDFDIVVSGISSPGGLKTVSLPTWSESNGQDDIKWYTAERQADGTYRKRVRISDHNNVQGEYNVHLYYVQNDGRLVGVSGTKTTVSLGKPKGTISIQNRNKETGDFDIVVSGIVSPGGLKEVSLPTWSEANGQDDIKWYNAERQADGTYRKRVRLSDHKNVEGEYNVHLYYVQNDGSLVGVNGTKTTISIEKPKVQGKISIQNRNSETGDFDIVVSDIVSPGGLKEVSLPTWSEANGQDDIKWYTAERQADGTYRKHVRASDHNNVQGEYNVHLYYVQNDGKLVGAGGIKTNVSISKPQGKISIQNRNSETGDFDIVVSGIVSPGGLKNVSLPTWSEANGQDDIKWYNAERQPDGTYRKRVRVSDHKNVEGEYNIHLYYVQNDGKLVGAGGIKTNVSLGKPKGNISIQNKNNVNGSFDVVISNVSAPYEVSAVSVPVWSEANGQDDIIWYTATQQANGTYKVTVESSKHKDSVGKYHIHLYYVRNDGQLVGVGGTTTNVSAVKPQGKISIQNRNSENGDFDIVVSDIVSPGGLKNVSLPTWSEANGQDDIKWYNAERQPDGTYRKRVRASDHNNVQGEYNVHLYYVQNDGKLVGAGGIKTNVSISKPQGKISIQNKNNDTGEFDIVVSGIVAPEGLKTVYLPTWSEANGQDDIQWYTADRQADGTYRKHVYARDHKNNAGEYNVHLYYLNNQNQLQGAGGEKTSISVNRPQAASQRDRVLAAAAAMVGVRGGSAEHQRLVNDYNSVRPLPVGYAVKNTDDWCDIFTTVIFQREGLSDLIGRECGVERHIHIFQRLGIWNEDGNSTPSAGDIITFNWDKDTQQNDGWADHIGIVEKVENGIIHTIEGNSNNVVKRNTYRIGHGNIRGFATPRYR
ncbi:GBS Bsp-like repeat-containing protein [Streptococcus sanguinis]|uniref:Lysozyme n=1 Tax=Streptococcus sanguinis TaxID=1305 RepID=A0A2X3XF62_STRSA|nr:GBS Bsp-like repeat-containing protein [Streptococcus sanguinis]EGJ44087.1 N-acetylmuramidase/lysin [Streptococcus sanguinis SK1059]EGQ20358.1 N-acetylmuramidase/lysin [Streptococcus sanguinis ATCC 29667]EGQ23985.1 N-acetylmuramidase/lysin [Streptococcus sanguinis SK340]SQF34441.1 N-acetylmuramidase/lysin [Streptococcus sanguinis]